MKGDEIITYMMLMLKKANDAQLRISKKDLGDMAKNIQFYSGVTNYFNRINDFVKTESGSKIKIKHYILSSGLKEILEKTSIAKRFSNIFASEYYYDHYSAPVFPKLVVSDTVKTQFLFRINKGKEEMDESINEYMHPGDRPIPFSNIVYIGDGLTDVPCMTVTMKNGGYAIAVYKPKSKNGKKTCKSLFKSRRVDFIAPADYTKDSQLDKYLKTILKTIIQGVVFYNTQRDMVKRQGIR